MQKITPFLWFNDNAEEAMDLYTSLFENSAIKNVHRIPEGATHAKSGSIMTATFVLNGQEFMVMNGGPHYSFSPAISLFVSCKDQAEVDHFYDVLAEGGKEQQCGWVTDKFGVTWQIVPDILGKVLSNPDPAKVQRGMQAMLGMKKLIVADLLAAVE